MPYNPQSIEKKWQQHWLENKSFRALDPAEAGNMPKAYVLDMFPYPSGAGLHVGHPEGYTATDIVSRYLRMNGHNVLHPMGWDAFGLPAEQYAIKTNTHPRATTEKNIANFRRQIQMLGLSYDWDREVDTTDPSYYRWTQWIFLQLFNSYFDPILNKAMPIDHLMNELANGRLLVAPDGTIHPHHTTGGLQEVTGEVRIERTWNELSPEEQREAIDGQRLAYMDEAPVNWCPGLGTVLSNEEVIDGRSEVGGFAVERRPMRQWMLRITAYADRLLDDLAGLEWPQSLKEMQRNWIGKSIGAEVDFEIVMEAASAEEDGGEEITVFTTRPDTLYGATYLVLSPEHPLVDAIATAAQAAAVAAYRQAIAGKSERDRMAETREKTGVFTGAFAINPVNDERIPIWISDYVLMGYGTGAIMAVPAHDQRDYEFAQAFKLPIREVVRPVHGETPQGRAFGEHGIAIHSLSIDGLPTEQAIERMIGVLDAEGTGMRSVKYKLRDWLFSRQRYWGEPFPIARHDHGTPEYRSIPESELPVALPHVEEFRRPETWDPHEIYVPLAAAPPSWKYYKFPEENITRLRELLTMPQWAGSCWYYLRYIDPRNADRFVDPAKEKYWMPVDLYVGGVEHAVLHLLYARFWHKVLYDLGHVSSPEPFRKLVNQGLILGETEIHAFTDTAGKYVSATEARDVSEEADADGVKLVAVSSVTGQRLIGQRVSEEQVQKSGDGYALKSDPSIRVDARSFKMSKSRGNVVTPDQIVADYGADTFRLYEMYMGPLEAQKPWNTRDIVGMSRFLSSVWRIIVGDDEEQPGKTRVADIPITPELGRRMHRAMKKTASDITGLRFNTAIAELIELKNEMTALAQVPRELAENFTLMLAPFAPHLAEEIWLRLGHAESLSRTPWPKVDGSKLASTHLDIPVQVNGKLRSKVTVPVGTSEADILSAAEGDAAIAPWLLNKTVAKRIYVPGKLVNFVVK